MSHWLLLLVAFFIVYLFVYVSPVSALSSHTYYVHQDHLGSVVSVTDETGSPVSQNKYLPYGRVEAENTSIPNRVERGYTGQIKDQTTTLSYYNARYYDPTLSRFISADSVGGGNYAYVGGNPISQSDPTGNIIINDGGGGGGTTPTIGTNSVTPYTPTFNAPPLGATQIFGGTLGLYSISPAYRDYGKTAWQNDFGPLNGIADLGFAGLRGGVAGLGLAAAIVGYGSCPVTGIGCAVGAAGTFGFAAAGFTTYAVNGDPLLMNTVTGGMAIGSVVAALIQSPIGQMAGNYLKPPVQVPTQQLAQPAPVTQETPLAAESRAPIVLAPPVVTQLANAQTMVANGQAVIADPAHLPFRTGTVTSLTNINPNVAGVAVEIGRVINPIANAQLNLQFNYPPETKPLYGMFTVETSEGLASPNFYSVNPLVARAYFLLEKATRNVDPTMIWPGPKFLDY